MIDFMTYEIATGRLLQTMRCADIHGVELQCSEGVDYVFGHHDRALYMVRDGEVVAKGSDEPEPESNG